MILLLVEILMILCVSWVWFNWKWGLIFILWMIFLVIMKDWEILGWVEFGEVICMCIGFVLVVVMNSFGLMFCVGLWKLFRNVIRKFVFLLFNVF